jgi:hypothetical protein
MSKDTINVKKTTKKIGNKSNQQFLDKYPSTNRNNLATKKEAFDCLPAS